MFNVSGLFKKMAGIATAVMTTLAVGCHIKEPMCYYGPAPMPDEDVADDDLKPEVLDGDQNVNDKNYRGNPVHSNEALDVYGPPPDDLDPVDINPDMLNQQETDNSDNINFDDNQPDMPAKIKKERLGSDGYPKVDEPPVMRALYGVQMDMKDK